MDLVNLARNPVPSGARCAIFRSPDGVPLRYAIWQASRGPRRGTVCIFSGRSEFIEKYFEVVADLRRRGFAVAIMDWRGQGGSGRLLPNPRKGHVRDYKDYDVDVVRFMRDIVLPDCPPPFTALAHSMGGTVMLRAATVSGSWFDRMVLVAPMVKLAPQSLRFSPASVNSYANLAGTLGLATSYMPTTGDEGWESEPFETNVLTSSRERYNRNRAILEAEPALGIGGPTVGWYRASVRAMNEITKPGFARRLHVPLLFIAAANDQVVSSRAIEDLAVQVKVGTHIVVPHARHEILQESDELRQQFWAAFDAYVASDGI